MGHYFIGVKDNQPALKEAVEDASQMECDHGRIQGKLNIKLKDITSLVNHFVGLHPLIDFYFPAYLRTIRLASS